MSDSAAPTPPAQAAAPVPAPGWTEASLGLMVLIWGVNFAVVKWALEAFPPLGFNALRYALASVAVFAVLRARGPVPLPRREDWGRVAAMGAVGNLLYQMTFILGLERTRAGNASVMLAVVPVFVLLMGARPGERQGAAAWLGAALSVVGVALVSGAALRVDGTANLVGDAIIIGAAALWALYTVGSRPLVERYGSVLPTAWTLWVGGAALVLIGIPDLLELSWADIGAPAWGGLLFSALFSIALAYLLWYRGVERLGGARTAIFSNLAPVVALITGAVWLDERLTAASVIGTAMVLGGVMLVRRD